MKTELKITPRDGRSLRGRVSHLGVDMRNIKRVAVEYADPIEGKVQTLEVWNRPGKRNSVAILTRLARDLEEEKGFMNSDAAYETLRIFGGKFVADSVMHEGKHPVIDLMRRIEAREIPYAQVRVVEHKPVEVLPAWREKIFKKIAERGFARPAYIHFSEDIETQFGKFAAIPAPFGLTVRYAMKANSVGYLLNLISSLGGKFDASTFEEFERATLNGIPGSKIRHTAAQVPTREQLERIINSGADYTACSLLELDNFGRAFPRHEAGIRFNSGIASGWTPQTKTGGPGSPFGIYQKLDEVKQLLRQHKLRLTTFHYHIGSGADPQKQKEAIHRALEMIREFPTVTTINVGGGVKIGRMEYDDETDILALGRAMAGELKAFYKETGRKLHLEIEPGTAMVAKSGNILAEVSDIVDNRPEGFQFIRFGGAGMNMSARATMYGAEHPYVIIPMDKTRRAIAEYVAFGDRCESGDCMSPRAGQPESMDTRLMRRAKVGDLAVVGATGAYGDSMAPHQYNSGVVPAVFFVTPKRELLCVRERGSVKDIVARECLNHCGSLS